MACLHTSAGQDGFRVTNIRNGRSISLPWRIDNEVRMRVQVWSNTVSALHQEEMDYWFSSTLDRKLKLVFMPDRTKRRTDGRYANSLNSFSDGFPYLILSQASLDDLNEKLRSKGEAAVPMDRFRPNLVIAGGNAFQEDEWRSITINNVSFDLVKPCARCVIVTTDQQKATRGPEPLRTLSTYRRKGNKVMFAMNAVSSTEGTIMKGDPVSVIELRS